VDYDQRYLAIIPSEVVEKDYGCGDPTPWKNGKEVQPDRRPGSRHARRGQEQNV
jgi:hypothetical protein